MARLSGDKTDDNFVGGVKGKLVNTADPLFNFFFLGTEEAL